MKPFPKILLFTLMAALAPSKLLACATCGGGGAPVSSPMAEGMNWGIYTLMAVIAVVLAAFLTFLIYAIRKSEAMEAQAAAQRASHSPAHTPEPASI